MAAHRSERFGDRRCRGHRPVGSVERRQQREARRHEIGAVCHEERTTGGDGGTQSIECAVVAAGHREEDEAPHPPSGMALGRALRRVYSEQDVRTEAHDDQQLWNRRITEVDALEHGWSLGNRADIQRPSPSTP